MTRRDFLGATAVLPRSLIVTEVPLRVTNGYPFLDIWVAHHGPIRMLLDTGAESTSVDVSLAQSLDLRPSFRTELINPQARIEVVGATVDGLRLGGWEPGAREILWFDHKKLRQTDHRAQGVLGWNVLSGVELTISHSERRLVLGHAADGEALPFELIRGRPAIVIHSDTGMLTMILDSGIDCVATFGNRAFSEFRVGRLRFRGMAPIELPPNPDRAEDGLLPLRLFRSVSFCEGQVRFRR